MISKTTAQNRASNRTAKVFDLKKYNAQPWKRQLDAERFKPLICTRKKQKQIDLEKRLGPCSYSLDSFTDKILLDRNEIKKGRFLKMPRFHTKSMKTVGHESYFRPSSPRLYLEKYRKTPQSIDINLVIGRDEVPETRYNKFLSEKSICPTRYGTAAVKNKGIGNDLESKKTLNFQFQPTTNRISKLQLPITQNCPFYHVEKINSTGSNLKGGKFKELPAENFSSKSNKNRNKNSTLPELFSSPDPTFFPPTVFKKVKETPDGFGFKADRFFGRDIKTIDMDMSVPGAARYDLSKYENYAHRSNYGSQHIFKIGPRFEDKNLLRI